MTPVEHFDTARHRDAMAAIHAETARLVAIEEDARAAMQRPPTPTPVEPEVGWDGRLAVRHMMAAWLLWVAVGLLTGAYVLPVLTLATVQGLVTYVLHSTVTQVRLRRAAAEERRYRETLARILRMERELGIGKEVL